MAFKLDIRKIDIRDNSLASVIALGIVWMEENNLLTFLCNFSKD